MGSLGDGDASAGALSDVGNLAASTSDDASNHIGGDADVLGLDILTILVGGRWGWAGVLVRRTAVTARVAGCSIAEVGTVASTVERSSSVATSGSTAVADWGATLDSDGRVVEDSAIAALFIVDQALANLPDGLLDTFGGTLDLDDTLS